MDCGTTTAYGQATTLDSAGVTSHAMNLSGLPASTTHHFRVRSRDAGGNVSTSADSTFATTAAGTPSGGAPLASYGFTEATGTATADGTGNGFNGTLVNGPIWTSGHGGNALLFDGVNDKVTLPTALDIPALRLTFESWINPTNRSNWRAIFSKRSGYSAAQMRFDVGLHITTGRVYVTTYRSMPIFAHAPPLNAWTHIAIVADSSGTKLYVNGTLNQTLGAVLLGTHSTALATIGNTGTNDDPFAGTIDDVRLYNRALTQSQIQADMRTSLP